MEDRPTKVTVIARLHLTLDFNIETQNWLKHIPDAWFAHGGGSAFLNEFGGTWWETFDEVVNPELRSYFRELGVPPNYLPFIQRGESYRGSFEMDAALVMAMSVGVAYQTLKGISELPKIADGLTELKGRIVKKLKPRMNAKVSQTLYSVAQNAALQQKLPTLPPLPPETLSRVDFVIDARPLRSLTPAILKSHKIHLSCGISRDSFTLENLGDEPLQDVQIGLFRTATQRNQWSYQDSYMGKFPLVSAHQTIAKSLGEFRDTTQNRFDLSDGNAVFVDCWVQDNFGIYLFNFFLERT